MKIRVPVMVEKIVEAPEFIRPYLTGEKDWFYMESWESQEYEEWYDALTDREEILDCGAWTIVEDE